MIAFTKLIISPARLARTKIAPQLLLYMYTFDEPFSLGQFVFPFQTTSYSLENCSFIHLKIIHSFICSRLFENLKARILTSIIIWSVIRQQTAKKVYYDLLGDRSTYLSSLTFFQLPHCCSSTQ